MKKLRFKRGVELGILMDALLVAYRDRDKHTHIPKIREKIAQRLEDAGIPFEEVHKFIKTIERWIYAILNKEV
jgi:transposase